MVDRADLVPYISAVLARAPASGLDSLLSTLVEEVVKIIPKVDSGTNRAVVERIDPAATSVGAGTLHSAGLIYSETRSPRWAPGTAMQDVTHQLVLVCRRARTIAIVTTDPGMGRRLYGLFGSADSASFGKLAKLPAAQLNGAFLGGETRTVWMSGLHRRTTYKADSKILAGTDLKAVLEPLGDQTYRFTAARGLVGGITSPVRTSNEVVVGVNPLKSRIWAGPSKEWNDFATRTWHLLGAASDAEPLPDPLPVLASAATTQANLEVPYDVSLIDPILLTSDGPIDAERLEEAEKWADRASFRPTVVTNPLDFTVEVTLDGATIGSLQFVVDITEPGEATITVDVPDNAPDELRRAQHAAQRRGSPTVRYESGHTITDGHIYAIRFKDRPFDKWMWEDFDVNGRSFEVTKEKPILPNSTAFDPAAIGTEDEPSLFSWIVAHWKDRTGTEQTGWLACDDGANEIADFIHLDESQGRPLLSLIHVKGSGSPSATREISTSDYEVVVGQAIKNLRFLDLANLADRLKDGARRAVAPSNWKSGVKDHAQRSNLIAHLREIGTNVELQVVVLQPRVRKRELIGARQDADDGKETSRLRRTRQLDALLLEAEAACRNLNAGFIVVGDRAGR
jgi:hypothetical protein